MGNTTIEELAQMIQRGFDGTATKDQVKTLQKDLDSFREEVDSRFQGVELRLDSIEGEIKEIKTVMGPLVRIVAALEIDIRELQSRVDRLEKKTGLATNK